MWDEISTVLGPGWGGTCLDYCEFVQECLEEINPPENVNCWVNDEYCDTNPTSEWYCDCLCMYPSA
jgi:hypothetical protein